MKIRTDFVTNSSSVSYIITMDLNIVDCMIRLFAQSDKKREKLRIAQALRDFMIEHGTINYLHEHEIHTYLMEFADDDGTAIDKKMLEENDENTDPLKMNEQELFNYIRGEFIHSRKLGDFFSGFGAVQVEQY